jgi:RNA ligase (TIGR02306 family)
MNTKRAMATIRKIDEIRKHPNADALDLATIDGWQCVVKRGDFKTGDIVVFCEIDSWVPYSIASFLSKGKEPKVYEGVAGERLRSIKLRGELSQGLVLPLTVLTQVAMNDWESTESFVGTDVSELLNIKKWEKPISSQLVGIARGNFPSFLRKTDQERIQNQFKRITPEQFKDVYEVTLKIDGSSCTFYHNNGEVGVCSRNLELKTDESNADNMYLKMFNDLGLQDKLQNLGLNIAVQGELWGSGINGNWENISGTRFSVFDIFDINKQCYMNAMDRRDITEVLGLQHVPVIECTTLEKFHSVADFLAYADRPSIYNKVAEGVVFKSLSNPDFSFKAINNKFLLNGGE